MKTESSYNGSTEAHRGNSWVTFRVGAGLRSISKYS